jgi:type II secretory pathway pseudopilin PulG
MTLQKRIPKSAAFTMVEIMVAIAIFAFIMTAIFGSWHAILRGTRSAQEATAAAQRARIATQSLEDALKTVQLFSGSIQYYPFEYFPMGDYGSLSLSCRVPSTFPGYGMYPDQVMRRVSFFVQPDSNNVPELVMTQVPLLYVTNDYFQPYPLVIAKDVKFFFLEFYDQQRGEWLPEWIPTNQIPKVVRVSLGTGSNPHRIDEPNHVYITTINIQAFPVDRTMQLAANGQVGGPRPPGQPNNPNQPPPPGQPGRPGGGGGRGNRGDMGGDAVFINPGPGGQGGGGGGGRQSQDFNQGGRPDGGRGGRRR